MKLIVIFIISLISFIGISQVNEVDSKGRKQGEWVKYYENSNVPKYTGQFKNDKPVGKFVYYYPSNKVKTVLIHEENSPRSEAYFYHENKNLLAFGIYMNEEKDSVWTHYGPSGRISFKETYQDGKLHGLKTTYYVPELESDRKTEIMREAIYKNDRLNGPVVEYFPGGIKKMEGTYKEGQFEGVVKRYHTNGQIMILERWKNQEKHGWWFTYDEQGKEIGRVYYFHGEKLEDETLTKHLQKLKEEGKNPNE